MSDKKLIAVIGDYGFTSYPLMTACLNAVIIQQKLDPKEVAIVNSNSRGAEAHAAQYSYDYLGGDPVAVEIPWKDLSEPCRIGVRTSNGEQYNQLAGVKRDNKILEMPNLVAVVFFHLAGTDNKQLDMSSRFPRLIAGAKVPAYVFQVGTTCNRAGRRTETHLLPKQSIPEVFLPSRDLKKSTYADQPWVNRMRDHADSVDA